MVKKLDASKINIADRTLKRRLYDIAHEIPIKLETAVGTSSVKIVSFKDVDPNDNDVEKEAKLKKEMKLKGTRQLQIELDRQDAEKRDKEETQATLKALWPK